MAATYQIAVIGDWESVMGFRALGLDTYPVNSAEEAREKIKELAKTNCAVIYLTERLAKDMEDVLLIRESLEVLAVQLACVKITKEQIHMLEEKVAEFEQVIKTGDIKLIAQTDIDFHDIIYQAAGNPRLMGMLNNLREQIYRYRIEYLKDEKNYPHLMEEHKKIIEGLKCRKKDYVAKMMKNHMINQANEVRNIIRRQE